MTNKIQPGPEGFALGIAAKPVYNAVSVDHIEWLPAWIRETEAGADVIWISPIDGDYSGLFRRVEQGAYIINAAALA